MWKKYLVDYRNLIKKPKQLSLIADDLWLAYVIVIHWISNYQAKKCGLGKDDSYCQLFQLSKLDDISGCMSEYRSWNRHYVKFDSIPKNKHSRDMYDEAFLGQRSWLYILAQCLAHNSCSRNMCWINKGYKGYFGLLRSEQYLPLFWMLAWDLYTLQQFLLFAASNIFFSWRTCILTHWHSDPG